MGARKAGRVAGPTFPGSSEPSDQPSQKTTTTQCCGGRGHRSWAVPLLRIPYMPIPALFWHSNPTVRLQAFHKFESQLHFMLHWHLKMDFLVGENDILLEEVTQDNLNPTLSKKQLAPFTQGNSLYPSDIQCLHSLSFLYPLPLVTLVIHRNIFIRTLGDTQLVPRNNGSVLGTHSTVATIFWGMKTNHMLQLWC